MQPNKYWIDRALEREDRANRDANKYLIELKKQYERAMLDIEKEISIFYGKYAEDNSISYEKAKEYLSPKERVKFQDRLDYFIELVQNNPNGKYNTEIRNMSNRVRITRYQALLTEIRAHIDMLFGDKYNGYEPRTTSLLSNAYEESYYRTKYDTAIGLGVGKAFSGLNQNAITEAINYPWSGANYSNRIWEQKAKLITNLNNTITQGMVQGSSIDNMTQQLSQKMDVGYKNAQRLIRTESNHVLNNGVLKSYADDGIDQYEYVATLDLRTSSICQSLDGKIFDVEKARSGVNYPPLHPNCRSTTVAYFDDDDRADYERLAKGEDGKYYKVPADMNYNQWYNKYVEPNKIPKTLKVKDSFLNEQLSYFDKGKRNFIPNKSMITDVNIIAGMGVSTKFRVSESYATTIGGSADEWMKKVGRLESSKYVFDIHWVEHDKYGPQSYKIKSRKEK